MLIALMSLGMAQTCETDCPTGPVPPAGLARIVVVVMDDIGYGALTSQTSYKHKKPPAPTLDSLAESGMRFTRAYATPVCTPSRASLFTGRDPTRDAAIAVHQPLNRPAVAASWPVAFQAAGWNTDFVGKWHLDGSKGSPGVPILIQESSPGAAGFDTWLAVSTEANDGPRLAADQAGTIVPLDGDTSATYFDRTRQFLKRADGPALAVVSLHNAHRPYVADEKGFNYVAEGGSRGYWAETRAADRALGVFIADLKADGMWSNTLLLVASDNGGKALPGFTAYPNGELKGFKTEVNEGGVRVPMLISWPAGNVAGVVSEPVRFTDIGHTLTGLARVPWAHLIPTDGYDWSAVLTGGQVPKRTTGMGWDYASQRAWLSADGRWKLQIVKGKTTLHDLQADPTGTKDVAGRNPERVSSMKAELAAWRASTKASATCADYPDKECGPQFPGTHWVDRKVYEPWREEWCARPEFETYMPCERWRTPPPVKPRPRPTR